MRNLLSILVFSIFVLSFCSFTGFSNKGPENQALPIFIIGKWTAVVQASDENGDYEKEYIIEFVDDETVTLRMRAPVGGINTVFDYSFIDNNTLLVENERAKDGKWFINRVDENLNICIWTHENCMEFQRVY